MTKKEAMIIGNEHLLQVFVINYLRPYVVIVLNVG